jgi:hypothetical protein
MTQTRRDALRFAGVALFGGTIATRTASAASPSVTTDWADPTGTYSYLFGGTLESLDGANSAECYFEYRRDDANTWSTTPRQSLTTPGQFTGHVTDLAAMTTYVYRAVAVAGDGSGTTRGASKKFWVQGARPTVRIDQASDIDATAATLNATLVDMGDADTVDVYFRYRRQGGSWKQTERVPRTTSGSFSARLTDLDAGATYEANAIAEGYNQTSDWSGSATFQTETALSLQTDPATAIGETAVTLNGTVTDLGGASSLSVWFTYFEVGSSVEERTAWETLTAPGTVSVRVSDLTPNAQYGFQLHTSTIEDGPVVGGIRYVTTDTRLAVTTTGATDVEATQATLNAAVDDLGSAGSVAVTFDYRQSEANEWTTAATRTVETTGDVSATVTDLQDGTTYEYRTTATASDGDTTTGGTATFTTPVMNHAPTVERLEVTDISPPNPHVDLHVEWAVADQDGNLRDVTVTIHNGRGELVYENTTAVDGARASGTENPGRIKKGAGQTYAVALHVRDQEDATNHETTAQSFTRFR